MQVCNNTTPNDIFGPLLKYMEKKTKNEMQPIGGKNLLLFLDDLDLNENSELAEPLRFFKENHTWIYQNELKYFDKVTINVMYTYDLILNQCHFKMVRVDFGCIWPRNPPLNPSGESHRN